MHDTILEALQRGDHATAETEARRGLTTTPDNAQLLHLLSLALRGQGDLPGALQAIEAAIERAPHSGEMHVSRAALLLAQNRTDEARTALEQSAAADPNQFTAYVMQGQLALARGDLSEAARLQRLAERLAPEHGWTRLLDGAIALQQGRHDEAIGNLTHALAALPDDVQILQTLGLAYLAKGYDAFAESSLARALELQPTLSPLRLLLAGVQRRQGHLAESRETLVPLLGRADAPPAAKQMLRELDLREGRVDEALPALREAFLADPQDLRNMELVMQAWGARGLQDEAATTLDQVLNAHADFEPLWHARLAVADTREQAMVVLERWLQAKPTSLPALEAMLQLLQEGDDPQASDAVAKRILAIEPGRMSGQLHILDGLLQSDPAAAVRHVEGLMLKAKTEDARIGLTPWLGFAMDRAGRHRDAVETWEIAAQSVVDKRLPLPPVSGTTKVSGESTPVAEGTPAIAFLWGAPGTGVDNVAMVIGQAGYPLLIDRYGVQPPQDAFQNYGIAQELRDGTQDGEAFLRQWRQLLPARGSRDGYAIDWILWWDNALVPALQTQVPEGRLLVALRDPRDALLEWLGFGGESPIGFPGTEAAATWLAAQCDQVLALRDTQAYPTLLIRTDEVINDAEAFAAQVGSALGLEEIHVPPAAMLRAGAFPPGHWRAYRDVLAKAFAVLTPRAVALGYPED